MRVCAAIVRDGAILMVRHEHDDGRAYWTLPGGLVEQGESLEAAALREVREEVGLEGTVGDKLYETEGEVCFSVAVAPDAEPVLGRDPELDGRPQLLVAVGWHLLSTLTDDVQVSRMVPPIAAPGAGDRA